MASRFCAVCDKPVSVNLPPGPIPPGHLSLCEHRYLLCDECRKLDCCPYQQSVDFLAAARAACLKLRN